MSYSKDSLVTSTKYKASSGTHLFFTQYKLTTLTELHIFQISFTRHNFTTLHYIKWGASVFPNTEVRMAIMLVLLIVKN